MNFIYISKFCVFVFKYCISKSLTSMLDFQSLFFSMWYKFWAFKNPIFNSHFYSGVCWLLSPTFDSRFSTSEQFYFLLSSSISLPNPILWIFVGIWATENTLGTDNCVDLSLSSWVSLSLLLLTYISFLLLLFFM